MKKIKIKYFDKDYPRLEKIEKGDWIDLRVNSIISADWDKAYFKEIKENGNIEEEGFQDYYEYSAGDVLFLGLGIAMELPEGYEAHIVPRSSTFKNTGFILTNGKGIIDNKYCGNQDEWKAMVYCTRDGVINKHYRLFQFRIQEKMPEIEFEEVEHLGNENRGGYGSTGIS